MLKLSRIVAALTLIVVLNACSAPIHKVESKGYGWGPQKGVTLAQVKSTIEQTALDQGWLLSDVKTGSFTAKREWGGNKHNIVVAVIYNLKTFSIRYKDSKQMGYSGDSIHKTYNQMIERLEDKIKTNVSVLTP